MATYKEIKGTSIQLLSSDPSNPQLGQIWFNTTSQTLKGIDFGTAAWATGGTIPTALQISGSSGSQTAAVTFGGNPSYKNTTFKYDGSSWTTSGNLGTGRSGIAGAGTQTATVGFGGQSDPTTLVNTTEEYDGSSWTSSNPMNTPETFRCGSAGTQTAALSFTPAFSSGNVESYNGTTWTAETGISTSRAYAAGCGTQTAALAAGGADPPNKNVTEEYDGSSWTNGGNMGTGRYKLAGAGTQTVATVYGGQTPSRTDATEVYDGSTWTNSAPLSLTTSNLSGTGAIGSAALQIGGYSPPGSSNRTEEFTGAGPTTVTISGS